LDLNLNLLVLAGLGLGLETNGLGLACGGLVTSLPQANKTFIINT